MASFRGLLLLVLVAAPLTDASPSFIPPTCYSKVLSMAREATQWAAYFKNHYETVSLTLFCQNACVMYKMRTYISLLEGVRDRRCAYTRDVRRLGYTLRQLFIIMSEKSASVERRLWSGVCRLF
uniref:Uncharacterized protein n=1 Tax=Periophthalmus magnuspinnatus TaxID=409849 RepID=A0A3B3ZL31_9GOBI